MYIFSSVMLKNKWKFQLVLMTDAGLLANDDQLLLDV